jgi:hypothetical protein
MLIFRHIFLSKYWWQKSDIWSQASYRYPIFIYYDISFELHYSLFFLINIKILVEQDELWANAHLWYPLLPVCRFCWFLYPFNIHLYMHIFCCIFLSNYWWQKSDIWSQASYRYPISKKKKPKQLEPIFIYYDISFELHYSLFFLINI